MRDKIKLSRYLAIIFVFSFVTCQSPVEDHPHDVQGGHITSIGEIPTVSATIWTEKIELFVEFPALIVGSTSRFAAHFTILDKHQPIRKGAVAVSLIKGAKGIRHAVDTPSAEGIFTPALQPKEAGIYQLVFDIKTPSFSDKIILNDVKVFSSLEAAKIDLGVERAADITFLKEQAWKIDFQTTPVVQGEVFNVISTSGIWKVAPSDQKTLVASTEGRVNFKNNLLEGSKVKKGQLLMLLSSKGLTSNNLETEIKKSEADLDQAESEYSRKKQLFESDIVSKSEFEKIEQKYQLAKYTYENLKLGYSSGGKQVLAPIDGYIKAISVTNGSFANQGDVLLTITSYTSTLLEMQISPSYAPQLENIQNIWYQPKLGKWSSLKTTGGQVISFARGVQSDKPLLSLTAQITELVEMPSGSFTEVHLAYGEPLSSYTIPESALLEDFGRYTVMVQVSGEGFDRRTVTVGRRNGSRVQIKGGLNAGEVIVTNGSYQVKMASMSGQAPAHGHEH